VVGGTVFFLVLGRGVLFPISCELGFYPLLVRVGAKGGAFNLPRTPSTLFHSPFEKKFVFFLLLPSSLFFPALTSLPELGGWWCLCFGGDLIVEGSGSLGLSQSFFSSFSLPSFPWGVKPLRGVLAPLT